MISAIICASFILFLFATAVYIDGSVVVGDLPEIGTKEIDRVRRRKIYLICACVIFYILLAFRDITVGVDTRGYCKSFEKIRELKFGEREYGYTLLTYFIRLVSHHHRALLIVTSLFFPVCFYHYLKEEKGTCFSVFLSLIIVMAIEVFVFAFAGIRQTIALSLIMLSYKYLLKGKVVQFSLLILLASTFHLSALIFLIAYLFRKIKLGIWHLVLFVSMFLLGSFAPKAVIDFIGETFFAESYGQYGTQYESSISYTMLLLQSGLLMISVFYYKAIKKDSENVVLFNTAFLMLCFQVLTPVIAEFFRVAYYFSIALCLLIPRTIVKIPDTGSRNLVVYGAVGVMALYLMFFNNPFVGYTFFFI